MIFLGIQAIGESSEYSGGFTYDMIVNIWHIYAVMHPFDAIFVF